ncbi:MAG TPA: CBS domain-containing protein, partial [Symbiobacteriaceae bacterium]|nr:CBS domain-containing protein [Symbiobacteriaceae bacterium]
GHMGTTERDARAAAFLLGNGANLRAVGRFISHTMTPAQHALLYQLQNRGRWLHVNGATIRLVEGETSDYVGGLALVVHTLLDLHPTHAMFAAVQMGSKVYLVGRSEVPWVDAGRTMAAFGGGGHHAAASAVAKGMTLAEVTSRLEAVLTEVVERPLMARDVMTAPVKTITQNKPVREAERLMLRHGHSGLPVVDAAGRPVGMISLRDVDKARRHGYENRPVSGVMAHRVITVPPDMPLDAVQDLLVEKDIGRVPVVDGECMVGIITRSDLLGQLYGGPGPRWHRTLYAGALPAGDPAEEDPVDVQVAEAVQGASEPVRHLLRLAGQVAERVGVSAYAVGGFVRDLLMGRPNLDIDITVEGDGIIYARALAEALGARIKEVPRFRTAHIYIRPERPDMPSRVDVATARREFYEHAAALPLVEHADLREDLYRRDFSINAMAIPLTPAGPRGVVDFFGGMADLQARQIRILHTLSFAEDPTRILRAVRFAHRYGFTLEPETEVCARSVVTDGLLNRVSVERLRNELRLILQEPGSGGAMAALEQLGVLPRLLPGARAGEDMCRLLDRVEEVAARNPELNRDASLWVTKLLLLLHPLPLAESVRAVNRLKLRKEEAEPILHGLASWQIALGVARSPQSPRVEVVRVLSEWAPEGLLMLCMLGGEEQVMRYWRQFRLVRLAITGADLLAAGLPAGPQIRKLLHRVLAERLNGGVPDRESQLALALRYAKGD